MQGKVLAYVVRRAAEQPQLLVFEHRDDPEAGVQVPAGTLEPGEAPEAGVLREVEEESGLGPAQVRLVRKLAEHHDTEWDVLRHVFVLAAAAPLPDRWTHVVRGAGEDRGMVFEYYWQPITPALWLAGQQHRWLPLLDASEAA